MGELSSAAPVGYLLCDDLLFTSRIAGTARSLGVTVRTARCVEALAKLIEQQPPACVLIDLSKSGLDLAGLVSRIRALSPSPPRLVAYGSHVDVAALRAAREAGCDPVLPRSKFVEELPQALPAWLGMPA